MPTEDAVVYNFELLNQFLLGFRGNTFMPNIQECSLRLEQAIYGYNASKQFSTDPNYLWFEYTLNFTKYVSTDMTDAYFHCMMSGY